MFIFRERNLAINLSMIEAITVEPDEDGHAYMFLHGVGYSGGYAILSDPSPSETQRVFGAFAKAHPRHFNHPHEGVIFDLDRLESISKAFDPPEGEDDVVLITLMSGKMLYLKRFPVEGWDAAQRILDHLESTPNDLKDALSILAESGIRTTGLCVSYRGRDFNLYIHDGVSEATSLVEADESDDDIMYVREVQGKGPAPSAALEACFESIMKAEG